MAPAPTIRSGLISGNYWIGVILDVNDYSTANNDSDGDDASPIYVATPMCGNNVCESGETCETWGSVGQCQVDCGCCEGWDPVCFVAGTRVAMADGSTRPIEEIQVGDQVLAYDEDDETVVTSRVTRNFTHVNMHEEVVVINGSLRATSNHPFYVQGKLVPAGELKVGDKLTLLGKDRGRQSKSKPETAVLRVRSLERQPPVGTVYNIEVAWQHNYFAEGILVHNKTSTGGCEPNGGGEPPF